jgi:hypothetical protein
MVVDRVFAVVVVVVGVVVSAVKATCDLVNGRIVADSYCECICGRECCCGSDDEGERNDIGK